MVIDLVCHVFILQAEHLAGKPHTYRKEKKNKTQTKQLLLFGS